MILNYLMARDGPDYDLLKAMSCTYSCRSNAFIVNTFIAHVVVNDTQHNACYPGTNKVTGLLTTVTSYDPTSNCALFA